jgi:hypothetical protein
LAKSRISEFDKEVVVYDRNIYPLIRKGRRNNRIFHRYLLDRVTLSHALFCCHFSIGPFSVSLTHLSITSVPIVASRPMGTTQLFCSPMWGLYDKALHFWFSKTYSSLKG